MANRYQGLTFYEYHRQFSMNAAQLLEEEGIKVDWSVIDQTIFFLCSLGRKPTHVWYVLVSAMTLIFARKLPELGLAILEVAMSSPQGSSPNISKTGKVVLLH